MFMILKKTVQILIAEWIVKYQTFFWVNLAVDILISQCMLIEILNFRLNSSFQKYIGFRVALIEIISK